MVPGKTNMATLEKEEREKPIELSTLFGALFIIEIFQPSVLMFYLFIYIYSLDPLRFFFFVCSVHIFTTWQSGYTHRRAGNNVATTTETCAIPAILTFQFSFSNHYGPHRA